MEISSILGSGDTAATTSATAGGELGKQEFLQLLITQLQMQDPFEPMENTEMIAQLAQFSSLEQMENMNESLSSNLDMDLMLGQLLNNTMATTLIGKGIRSADDGFVHERSEESTLGYRLGGNAVNVSATIFDSSGIEVAVLEDLETSVGDHTFTWDGKDADGNIMSSGDYTFAITAEDGGGNEVSATELFLGHVEGVRYIDGSAYVVVNGRELLLSHVTEVMEDF
ncbi:MAG: flagellar hook assembly protein FlgD [Candidatus Eisenbacteria bacterium]|nr:flagellar hook assembly protein FlgD [Candidatus Eisenbacteria bacterium]